MRFHKVMVGDVDAVQVLHAIGGWLVVSRQAAEAKAAVDMLVADGHVQTRMHFDGSSPDGAEAYELTDAGMEKLAEWQGPGAAKQAGVMREWYRDNTGTPPLRSRQR